VAKTTRVTIEEFVRGLEALARNGFETRAVSAYVSTHPIAPESLQPYLFFSPANYTRNLVFKDDVFEVIAICWEVGQVSRIHNHRDQQCWMAVPIGKLENQNYRVRDRNPRAQTCRLEPASTLLISPTAPLAVDPEEPVHQVRNHADYGQRAVSIHIYSRPFNTCEVYSLEHGKYYDVELKYTSEYGKLCPGEKAALASV
ncbi:MAG: cysteine dioxygenase family protein, partial [Acidobacteria bacterium]|nr:cysteine dioxygenase family protein [Acidobacteriota bacterium]